MRSSQGASSVAGAKKRIRVVCRLRPTKATATIRVDRETTSLTVPNARGADALDAATRRGVVDHTAEGLRFGVDAIYEPDASQADVFEAECAPLVAGALDGVTGTLLAYGQTGAGKTYTVLGKGGAASGGGYDDRGLVPRAIARLFDLAARKRRTGASVEIRLSVLEVYNETLIDLLRPPPPEHGVGLPGSHPAPPELVVYEREDGGVRVKNLEVAAAASAEEAVSLLYDAEINRAVGSHAMNVASSRSHLVVTAHVAVRGGAAAAAAAARRSDGGDDDGDGTPEERFAKLHLVDLAGSERIKLTASRGATATVREAAYINRSLTFLEQVVIALADETRDHVPYRSSKLTHVLKDSLGGACRTSLVACLWPDAAQLDQTTATLRFAARMGRIACAPVANRRTTEHRDRTRYGLLLGKLRAEVDALRAELALRDLIRGDPPPAYASVRRSL